ncbi:uncharacterized protein [Apostichopus japonicus]|uniref:uncharacterized protein isoform X3 n=1 Tax=Stichopus japonicus TaxID=307972 RepID=UPI003AB6A5B5
MAGIVRGSKCPVLVTATITVFLLFLLRIGPAFGQSDPPYVAVVKSPVATTAYPTIIEVYTGDSQTANVTFDKAVDLPGSAAGYMFTLNSPRVPDEAMTNISSEPATLTLPTTMETAARTGIYTITVTEDESPVEWRVLVTNEAATIKALEYSTGASMGDSVTVMVESSVDTAMLRWRRDGVSNPDGSTGSSCVGKTSCGDASALKSVVFESQEQGAYSKQVHAIMNVIVRECPEKMWSPPDCTNTCEPCINGGVCSDLTGLCLCPPGFSGNNCENVHGRNVFGQNAEYKCDDSGDDHAEGCQGAIICYPDPLGCFCPAGYKGLNCTEECETGKFGANCKQECHCADNTLCALDTGVCENNQCEDGWRGTNCQYGPCPVGYYGDFCNLTCSCSGGEDACSEVEANCANGCVVPWTGTACNQDNGAGNIILTYVRVNSGQAANVTCTVIRNPLVAQSDLVLSPIGTLLTADEDARSYKQTKVVEITLETAMQVTCSVSGTELMETILLMPNGQSDPPYVAVVKSPVATTAYPTTIEVYTGDSQTASVTFDKAVLEQGRYMFTLNSPRVPDEAMTNINSEPATLTLPTTMETAARTGIYTITVTEDESPVEWRVLVTNEAATIKALEYSTGASMGDNVTVMVESSVDTASLRWRRDGGRDPDGSTGSSCFGKTSCGDASALKSVVFESQEQGAYSKQVHAIMNVIVRECPENMWSPPDCTNTCEPCINGGVCSDLTGLCLCPPGFSGNNCENVHGRNVFGQNAEYKCDDSGDDHAEGCQGAIICYPDPLGCFCPAGYKGLNCTEECETGKFGANCKQECHCADNTLCALDTGVCENNQCEDGWRGTNCQYGPCPVGYYGDFCNLTCSCSGGEDACSEVEANCANGCVVPWTGTACNQDNGAGNIILTYVRVNSGQAANVTCTVIRNPLVAQSDLVLSPIGTLLTADEDARSYKQTKVVEITLETAMQVTCSVSGTELMETILLMPNGQSDPPYVAVVKSPVATTAYPTTIEVYTGDSQTASVTFDKAVLEQGRYMFTLNSPRVPDEAMTNINSEPATLTLPTTMETAARTGIYTITVTEDESPVEWRVLVTNEAATIKALEYSTGASMGDKVTVMVESSVAMARLRWRRDGIRNPDGSTGSSCVGKTSCGDASALKSVVFESQEQGAYSKQIHAIMNVIVRECPQNMWSPPDCTNTCEPCINGGVCSDLTGLCLCPPGFSGNNCENIHGRNVFGQNAEYKCDDSGDDHADGCQGAIICYPDPLGCFCPAGYKGLNCTEECETGTFGANCKQECHCANNSLCALDTGVCENNQCEDGWRGTNCQYEFNPQYVAVVRSPVATTTNPTTIEVYTGGSQTANVTFDKAVLQGAADSQRYMFTLNSPRVPDEAMTNISSEPATLTLPTTMDTAARIGIYTITVTEDESPAVAWRVLVTNENATIKALEYSTGASMGDSVTVMVESSVDTARLRWRRDGVRNPDGSTGSSCFGKTSCGDASALKSVVFESHKQGAYSEQVHAIMNVIVRECPENMWSPPDCTNTCEPCINGGVCSDLTGLCLCPPGFSGNNCENIHGRNVFGQNAEYKCDDSGDDHADGCQGAIICYPDPLGCFCPAGYKGLNCTEECETGKFGANCKQECHCADNTLCALDTGVCENNQCEDGWRGTNCQYGPCPVGYYGDFCNLTCSCSGGEDACSEVEANCANGCAVPWTGIACNQDNGAGNIILTYVRVNSGQAANVTCTVIRNPLVAQSDLVLSPIGTLLTADEDARSYNQTKVVEITLETVMQVTCSVNGTGLMETITLMPNDTTASPVTDDATGITGSGTTPVSAVFTDAPASLVTDDATGSTGSGTTPVSAVSTDTPASLVTGSTAGSTGSGTTPVSAVFTDAPASLVTDNATGSKGSGTTPVSAVSTDTAASLVTDDTVGSTVSGVTPVSSVSTDTTASPVTDDATGITGSGTTPVSAVFTDAPASLVTDDATGSTGSGTTPVSAVSTDTPASLVTGSTAGSTGSGTTPVSAVFNDAPASLVTDDATGSTSSGTTPVSAVSTDTPASLVTEDATQTTGSGTTPVSAVSTDTPASLVTGSTAGSTGSGTTPVSAVFTDAPASLVTDDATQTTGSGTTPVSAVSTDTPASLVTGGTAGSTVSGVTPVSSVSTDTSASPVTDGTTGAIGSGATPASPVSGFNSSDESNPQYVAVVRSPVATTTNPTTIEVYTGGSQTANVTFDKAVLLPGGADSPGYMFTLNSPRVPDEAMTNINSEPATLTLPTTMETAARTGIYTITVTEDESPAVAWRVLVTNENATIKALEYSTGASMGDNVTVMVESSVATARLRWRRDGVPNPDGSTGSSCVGKTSCGDDSALKSVVFESQESGQYNNQVHAIMNVIVRECPENMWSPPDCTNTCEPCINGGVCSDLTGLCLCPPGFSGNNCENIHGRNVFGQNAEYKCDDSGDDHADGCQGAIICYPDPLGCFCPAGYKGLNCTEECETGTFGANCKQECHCADNALCALDTGVCGNNQCKDGWRGTNCQYESNPQYVAVVRSPVATTTNPTTIEVYTGGSQTANVTFDKAVLLPGGADSPGYMFTLNSPRVPDEAMTNINSEPATLTLPTTMETAARTGIYTITVTEDESPAVAWRVLVTNENATIKALEYSTGASMGDNVTVMVESSVATARLRWRRDGVPNPDGSTGSSCVGKTSCGDDSALKSVVFESQESGQYNNQVHAIMNVIVRECPENMWSPPDCTNTCEPCINGGVCSDLTGLCLCPPGFSGNNCENIHGRNVFGQNAEYKCDDSGDDHADGCQGAIICYPDPLGCFCPAGYKGLNCTEECETGTFGANCKQECHCADNALCALDTGVCGNNQCKDGWRGTNCQYESNPQYVAVVRSPVATTTNPTTIEVYTGGSQTANVTFDKAVLLPGGADSPGYMFTLNSPRVPDEAMTNINSEPATLTLPTTMETAARTGIYTITVTEDESPAVAWRVLVTNENATIKTLEYSTGASMGDSVTVMVESSVDTAMLRWRRDGARNPDGSTGSSCVGKTSCGDASALKSVVFESHETSEYKKQVHAIMNVIVRECPENMWSPPDCTNTCEPCINGGVCSDLTGLCLCPPGFSGNNCENIHGRNVFGQNAEYKCDDSGDDHADGCQGAIICYPDPLGCFCPAGYKGLNCTEECETGKFGANCKQECHCADNTLCALDTGVCGNNQCEDGWRGTNCQYGPCPAGYYGNFCNLTCSCSGGEDACSEVEANCANGCAVPWTGIACNQDNGAGNIILTYVRVNSGQAAKVTCTVMRNPLVAQSDLVLSPIGTLLTADEDARSYNQTKVVEITLETAMQVTCSVSGTELTETISLMPNDTSASPVTDGTTGATGSGATPASPVSRFKNRSVPLLTFIAVPLSVIMFILVFLVLCGCWIRCLCRQKSRSYHLTPSELISSRFVTNPRYNPHETDSNSSEGEPEEYADIDDKLIRISDLVIYVKQKKQNRKDNFFTEFKTLPKNQLYPCTVAGKPENKSKNRYLNILPYDNSRVMLKQVIDGPHSDYINASYIDGYKAPKKFIATQGPNEASLVDFWQMVWQENVATIVMLTSLIDGKKKVCLKYWPDQESIYGELLIKCEKLEEHFQYDYRIFTIALKHGRESRTVKHFHFTDWGDMKIPEFLDPILDFLKIVRHKTSQKKVPNTIVHCSAGVGRTGTYITLDAMLDMAQAEGKVNVYKFVTEMRQRRRQSVQVKEQYQFIFDTLVKNFCIGRTTMTVKTFGMALASLKRTNDETGETYLTEQFKKLEEISVTTSASDMYAAKNMENKSQNQCSTFLPVEAHTPVLKTPVGERNSRYINASLMDGYKKMDFFVATQMPLKNTVLDFWNLVWDHECSVIIMLNELDEKSDQYWPESTSVTFSPFTIKSLSTENRGTICVRKIEITNSALQKLRTVMQIQCLGWPNNETVSNSSELLLNCVHQLSQWRKERAVNRVLVHCMNGVGRTGVFCGLVSALDQAQAVKEVDIFQLISNMRSAQPLIIQNQEQYQTIFDAVLMHLETEVAKTKTC